MVAVAPLGGSGEGEFADRLVRGIVAWAARARLEPSEFFSLVMKEEKTQAPITCAPHQRVLFSFVMHHERCVVRMPVGSSKTFCMAALTIWLLGLDPTERGAIISASVEQAQKPLSMVQDYLENEGAQFPELALVFPDLRPSKRGKDAWQQNKIVVQRPAGIRDPSLVAIGYGGKLPGARLSWILVDDILDAENTATPMSRAKVNRWFANTVLSRKDIERSRLVVTNTPWNSGSGGADSGDLTYALEEAGWPCITMSIEGDITIRNADPDWDSDDVRPALGGRHPGRDPVKRVEVLRLSAHDSAAYGAPAVLREGGQPRHLTREELEWARIHRHRLEHYDLDEVVPLWPEKYPSEKVEELRAVFRDEFAQLYRCVCRDDESALCKLDWIRQAKRLGYLAGFHATVDEYRGPNFVGTGIDLGIGLEGHSDWTCLFTFELVPSIEVDGQVRRNMRRLLRVKYVRESGRDLVNRIIDTSRRFPGGLLKVETNAAQRWLREWVLDVDRSVPVLAHTTGINKHHRHLGVTGLFVEFANGAWILPSPDGVSVEPDVQRFVDDCLGYRPPPAHTPDGLIAAWIARTMARGYEQVPSSGESDAIAQRLAQR